MRKHGDDLDTSWGVTVLEWLERYQLYRQQDLGDFCPELDWVQIRCPMETFERRNGARYHTSMGAPTNPSLFVGANQGAHSRAICSRCTMSYAGNYQTSISDLQKAIALTYDRATPIDSNREIETGLGNDVRKGVRFTPLHESCTVPDERLRHWLNSQKITPHYYRDAEGVAYGCVMRGWDNNPRPVYMHKDGDSWIYGRWKGINTQPYHYERFPSPDSDMRHYVWVTANEVEADWLQTYFDLQDLNMIATCMDGGPLGARQAIIKLRAAVKNQIVVLCGLNTPAVLDMMLMVEDTLLAFSEYNRDVYRVLSEEMDEGWTLQTYLRDGGDPLELFDHMQTTSQGRQER